MVLGSETLKLKLCELKLWEPTVWYDMSSCFSPRPGQRQGPGGEAALAAQGGSRKSKVTYHERSSQRERKIGTAWGWPGSRRPCPLRRRRPARVCPRPAPGCPRRHSDSETPASEKKVLSRIMWIDSYLRTLPWRFHEAPHSLALSMAVQILSLWIDRRPQNPLVSCLFRGADGCDSIRTASDPRMGRPNCRITARQIHKLGISKLSISESEFLESSLWTQEFRPSRLRICLSQTLRNPDSYFMEASWEGPKIRTHDFNSQTNQSRISNPICEYIESCAKP